MPQIAGNDLSFHGCLVDLGHKEALMSLTDRGIHISFVTGNNIEFAVAFCHFHTAIVKGRADLTAKKLRVTGNCCCTVPVPVCIVADNADDLSGIVFFVVCLAFYQIISVRSGIKATPQWKLHVDLALASDLQIIIVIFNADRIFLVEDPHVSARNRNKIRGTA